MKPTFYDWNDSFCFFYPFFFVLFLFCCLDHIRFACSACGFAMFTWRTYTLNPAQKVFCYKFLKFKCKHNFHIYLYINDTTAYWNGFDFSTTNENHNFPNGIVHFYFVCFFHCWLLLLFNNFESRFFCSIVSNLTCKPRVLRKSSTDWNTNQTMTDNMNQPVWLLWYQTANVEQEKTSNTTKLKSFRLSSTRCLLSRLVGWLGKALAKPRGQCFEAFQTDPAIMNYNALRCFCCCHSILRVCVVLFILLFFCVASFLFHCWIDGSLAHTKHNKSREYTVFLLLLLL